MDALIIQIIRTAVPYLVGLAVTWLASIGLNLDPDITAAAAAQLTVLVGSLYYLAVAWLERKWRWFGWLLGVARKPVYEPRRAKHSAE
ncbi:hypothetical protein ACFWGP_05305 [Agromyces sp. NPDC127015]|uniref:hypothetical protein n=1 Tax=Agromyces sp. NPDC127015 TaxID=3347108 RepID=UPI00365643D9